MRAEKCTYIYYSATLNKLFCIDTPPMDAVGELMIEMGEEKLRGIYYIGRL
jgi:hypothetical protein